MGSHCRYYEAVWLLRTPICPVFPARKKKAKWRQLGKEVSALDSKTRQNEDVTNSKWKVGSSSPRLSSSPGLHFLPQHLRCLMPSSGICFSAPRTANRLAAGKTEGARIWAVLTVKYLLSTSWGQAPWRIQRLMWSRASNNLISTRHLHS